MSNIENNIKFIKKYMKDYYYKDVAIEDDFKFEESIKNVLSDRERLIKENEELKKGIVIGIDFDNTYIKNKIRELKEKLVKEYVCATKGFMKKQIPTSVVDGTIAQETGWIIAEIDKILEDKE